MKMNIKTIFGLAAVAGLLAVAAPVDRAQAVSLINPAASTSAKHASENITTEVHWRHHHHGYRRHHGYHHHHGWRRHHGWHHHRRHHWHHGHHGHRRHHWY